MNLKEFFLHNNEVAVALSGGVDSAVVLCRAAEYAHRVGAYFAKSAFQPDFELSNAKKICEQFHISLTVIDMNVLDCQDIIKNDADRCYHCKKMIFTKIKEQAQADGFDVIIDGTNASDRADDRPGMQALKELKIVSPLRICNINKQQVRQIAADYSIPIYNLPSYSCLATRVVQNTIITQDILDKIEKAENYLMHLGFKGFRVRYINGNAKIEVEEQDLNSIICERKNIIDHLSPYFDDIFLDMKVRVNE